MRAVLLPPPNAKGYFIAERALGNALKGGRGNVVHAMKRRRRLTVRLMLAGIALPLILALWVRCGNAFLSWAILCLCKSQKWCAL